MTDSPRKAAILKKQSLNEPEALQIKKQSCSPSFRAAHLANAQWNKYIFPFQYRYLNHSTLVHHHKNHVHDSHKLY